MGGNQCQVGLLCTGSAPFSSDGDEYAPQEGESELGTQESCNICIVFVAFVGNEVSQSLQELQGKWPHSTCDGKHQRIKGSFFHLLDSFSVELFFSVSCLAYSWLGVKVTFEAEKVCVTLKS